LGKLETKDSIEMILTHPRQLFVVANNALINISVGFGMGSHDSDLTPENKVRWTKYFILSNIFALLAVPVAKTSFAVTLLRIAAKPWHKWAIWFIMVTMNIVMFLVMVLLLAQCQPIERIWDKKVTGHCLKGPAQRNVSIFAGCKRSLGDTFHLWWGYRMRRKSKTLAGLRVARDL
jgi:hypothetical protein